MCAAAWVAAGVGAASLLGGMVQGKKSKKKTESEASLEDVSKALFEETDPIRRESLNRSMQAMLTGQTGLADDQVTRAKHSMITENQASARKQLENDLAAKGLLNSSYGDERLAAHDRATSMMLSASDTAELDQLLEFGQKAGFGGMQSSVTGFQTLAQLEAQRNLVASQQQQQGGQSAGFMLALALSSLLGKSGKGGGASTSGAGRASGSGTGDLELLVN